MSKDSLFKELKAARERVKELEEMWETSNRVLTVPHATEPRFALDGQYLGTLTTVSRDSTEVRGKVVQRSMRWTYETPISFFCDDAGRVHKIVYGCDEYTFTGSSYLCSSEGCKENHWFMFTPKE
jgi:hypothetical protein